MNSASKGHEPKQPVNQDRVNEVAEEVRGTCKMLEEFATEEELKNLEFLKAIDDQVFYCIGCGWWYEISDLCDDESETELVCIQCNSGD